MFMFWERVTNLRETLSMSIGDLLDTINKIPCIEGIFD